jgi:hypothetical protein
MIEVTLGLATAMLPARSHTRGEALSPFIFGHSVTVRPEGEVL